MALSPNGQQKSLDSGTVTPASPPHHGQYHIPHPHLRMHHGGQRLREFFRPDGRKVHVAATPEEHQRMKKQLSQSEKDPDFDLLIHGSPEHVGHVFH